MDCDEALKDLDKAQDALEETISAALRVLENKIESVKPTILQMPVSAPLAPVLLKKLAKPARRGQAHAGST